MKNHLHFLFLCFHFSFFKPSIYCVMVFICCIFFFPANHLGMYYLYTWLYELPHYLLYHSIICQNLSLRFCFFAALCRKYCCIAANQVKYFYESLSFTYPLSHFVGYTPIINFL